MSVVNVVIGASGGIGQAIVKALAENDADTPVYALSRSALSNTDWPENVIGKELATDNEQAISDFCEQLSNQGDQIRYAVCTVGILHGEVEGNTVSPEKRLEDLSSEQLLTYFRVNTLIPTLWLKHLVKVMAPSSVLACLSARVGSISDNHIGGWYGYRTSKAGLNMMIKTAAVEYARRAKGTSLLAYHPGTVDTGLSAPFQGNVKPEKLFTPAFTAQQLIKIMTRLTSEQSPYFIDWEDQVVSW